MTIEIVQLTQSEKATAELRNAERAILIAAKFSPKNKKEAKRIKALANLIRHAPKK